MKILAIETSCDETSAAVLEDLKVLSNVIASQIEIHRRFGGVVPEIASRNHTLAIRAVVEEALAAAGVTLSQIDAIAVTEGAGLLGALLVGVAYAKALGYALKKPVYAVNHIIGHIAANHLENPNLKPPYVCLIASGGHTAVALINDYPGTPNAVKVLGTTQDDAAGEAFDKVARALGLNYPGGPEIEKLAFTGKLKIKLPEPLKNQSGYDFSFSGLKTAVISLIKAGADRADIAASFENKVTEIMAKTAFRALEKQGLKQLVIAGGVAANNRLKKKVVELSKEYKADMFCPPLSLCTDNAAMIGAATYYAVRAGVLPAKLDLDPNASLEI